MPSEKEPLCSICCLGYNHEKFIEKAIGSIWAQEYKNIEIIAIDDKSSDNSAQLLETLRKKSPMPMKVILNDPNSGNVGHNFNIGLRQASGKFIMFMALDDYLYENAFSSKVPLMEENDSIAFITNSQITVVDANDQITKDRDRMLLDSFTKPTARDLLNLDYKHCHSFYIQGTLLRKDTVDAVGGFDEDMVGDDIVLRTKVANYLVNNKNLTFKVFKFPACYYRNHASNIHKNHYRHIQLVTQYLDRYHKSKPIPKSLKTYFYHAIKRTDWAGVKRLFEMNEMTRSFRYMPVTWFKLIKKCIRNRFNGEQ